MKYRDPAWKKFANNLDQCENKNHGDGGMAVETDGTSIEVPKLLFNDTVENQFVENKHRSQTQANPPPLLSEDFLKFPTELIFEKQSGILGVKTHNKPKTNF